MKEKQNNHTWSNSEIAYCTYFDRNYLLKGLCLLTSFYEYHSKATFYVLCLDEYTEKILKKLKIKGLKTISLSLLEKYDKELIRVKNTRNIFEYYWTCGPVYLLYIFENYKPKKLVYLDSDLFFFNSLVPALIELGNNSILIVEHRFPQNQSSRIKKSGKYNVAFQIFKNDKNGLACLSEWRKQCLAWCYAFYEKGKYGDQLYLNEWPKKYLKVIISRNIGIDVAPWNVSQYKISKKSGNILINMDKLICYHFHKFEILEDDVYEYSTTYNLSSDAIRLIYQPYIKGIKENLKRIKLIDRNYKQYFYKVSLISKIKQKLIKLFGPIYWGISEFI